jgi:hypothetical protein
MSDNWDFYFSQIENHPASFFVDLGMHQDVPIADLGIMAWLCVHLLQPRQNGLSGKEEFSRLCEMEDTLTRALANAKVKILYVGRMTLNGCREFCCYAANGAQAEGCLSSAMAPFPEYEFQIGSRPDPEWSIYRGFLYPSKRACQTIENRHVLESLEAHGDCHDIEREVTHWLLFLSRENRDGFIKAAVDKGYQVVGQPGDAGERGPFGLMLSRIHAVDFRTIHNVVMELFDLAGECGGDYDGWETSVKKRG